MRYGLSNGLILAALAASISYTATGAAGESRYDMPKNKPDDQGRRAEKNHAALVKAETKRLRKAAKRL